MADSGYTASQTVIPAFKRSPNKPLPPDKQQFNYVLSQQRVEVEHCIGMIKNQWQSLKLLRLKITNERSATRVNRWIRAVIVLHNFLLNDPCDWSILRTAHPMGSDEFLIHPDEADFHLTGTVEDTSRREVLFDIFKSKYLL